MSSYVVLARKWRPAQFSDIVGQGHIVRTLTNAVRLDRIHHAYVFTGCRGIGKTSIARIFSKVLRCQHTRITEDLVQSCDQCSDCLEITAGNSVNVMEIDGASNNGVEAVREIRDHSRYMPSTGQRKIYLIDEVHMLTTAAFNALLKTLEEPPAHVTFIFATTEPHKIPATILSRCQRFDYRRVTVQQIQTRLSKITTAEHITADLPALTLIARAADGSLRDALSLLDQVIAFSGSQITIQNVRECVGLIEGQALIGILSAIFQRQPLNALALVESAYQQGHDLRVLTRGLLEFLHGILLAKIQTPSAEAAGLELSTEEWTELQNLSTLRSLEEMELFFQVLHQGVEWIARSPQPKIVLTVLLIKCATAESLFHLNASLSTPVEPPIATLPHNTSLPRTTRPPTPPMLEATATLVKTPLTGPLPPPSTARPTDAPTDLKAQTPENFIHHVRKTRPLLASILEHASCSLDEQKRQFQAYFALHDAYFREQLTSKAYTEQLNQLAKDFFGKPVHFKIELKDTGESMAAKKEREQHQRVDSIRKKAENHPIIIEAKALFGGDLTPIDVREEKHAAST